MEALWSLEDKWKLSTQEAVLLFVCTAFSVIGVCTAVALKKRARRRQVVGGEDVDGVESMISKKWGDGGCGWGSIKRVLMGTVRWSGASKWDERPLPLLAVQRYEGDVGWQSHNSVSPVWQRPILMGEKCELPRFSGLILYDETGQPLHQPKSTIVGSKFARFTILQFQPCLLISCSKEPQFYLFLLICSFTHKTLLKVL